MSLHRVIRSGHGTVERAVRISALGSDSAGRENARQDRVSLLHSATLPTDGDTGMLQEQRKQLTQAQALLDAITPIKTAIDDARESPAMTPHFRTVLGNALKVVNDSITEITLRRDTLDKALK